MTIKQTREGEYKASYNGRSAYGYTIADAIINLLTLITNIKLN